MFQEVNNQNKNQSDVLQKKSFKYFPFNELPRNLRFLKGRTIDDKFEWLPLAELHENFQKNNNKRLRKAIQDYFQRNFLTTSFIYRSYNKTRNLYREDNDKIQMNGFERLIPNIVIVEDEDIDYVQRNCKSLKKIIFDNDDLNGFQTESIKHILEKLEAVEMMCDLDCSFDDFFLKFCKNLKYLIICYSCSVYENVMIGTENDWLRNKYPLLQYVEFSYYSLCKLKNDEIKIFFENNPNIRTFATDAKYLLENSSMLMETRAQLNVLSIDTKNHFRYELTSNDRENLYDLLKELYNLGFYKRLHLLNMTYDDSNGKLTSIQAYISKLDMFYYPKTKSCESIHPNMENLKVLGVQYIDQNLDFLDLIKRWSTLERICFNGTTGTTLQDIYEIVSHCANLKSIKINIFFVYYDVKDVSLDLLMLNKNRQSLARAKKVEIFVQEGTFLKTKKFTKGITNLSLIQLKLYDSYPWDGYKCDTLSESNY